jgi:hypothetical protein
MSQEEIEANEFAELPPDAATLRELIPVSIAKCEFSHTGLTIQEGLTFNEWLHLGNKLGSVEKSVGWWVGDWINYGVAHDKEWEGKTKKALSAKLLTHLDSHSQATYASLCASVIKSNRLDSLSLRHHMLVQSYTPTQQRKWLKAAVDNEWSVADMRAAMRAHEGDETEEPGKPLKTLLSWVMQGWKMVRDLGEPEKLPIEQQRQLKEDLRDIGQFWMRLAE